MFSSPKLLVNYSFFAILATIANIGAQDAVGRVYSGFFSIYVSAFVGTGIGLIVKYVLDKRFIFKYQTLGAVHDAKTFSMYTIMGLVTTIVFWGFEFGFHYLWQTKEMRYFGGVIGLTIGYCMKYYLDKRYVFNSEVI